MHSGCQGDEMLGRRSVVLAFGALVILGAAAATFTVPSNPLTDVTGTWCGTGGEGYLFICTDGSATFHGSGTLATGQELRWRRLGRGSFLFEPGRFTWATEGQPIFYRGSAAAFTGTAVRGPFWNRSEALYFSGSALLLGGQRLPRKLVHPWITL